jgi:prolyl 4-hydroxylase
MLIKHTPYIYEYENYVESEVCDSIINAIESQGIPESIFTEGKNRIRKNSCLNLTRCGLKEIKNIDNFVHTIFSEVHQNYLQDNKYLYFLLRDGNHFVKYLSSEYIYRKYDSNDYYDWHLDMTEGKNNLFSYLLYLNDDFSGGETVFLHEKLKLKPKKGSLLCFPCDYRMIHKSLKIKTGSKKIIWTCLHNILNNGGIA